MLKLSAVDGVVIIAPMLNEPLTLEERLAKLDPARHGGEVMTTSQRLGAEQW